MVYVRDIGSAARSDVVSRLAELTFCFYGNTKLAFRLLGSERRYVCKAYLFFVMSDDSPSETA